jgi:zinc/manganese transport system permease protein
VHWLLEPGLFTNDSVRTAFLLGAMVSLVSAVVGVFTVLRSQSFAGHALTDVAMAGGAGASLAGVAPLLGFLGGGVLGAGAMDAIGVQRVRGRDIATGVVLGAATGLAALFLFLVASSSAATGSTQLILFGSVFTVETSTLPYVAGLSALVLTALVFIRRPLLLSSLNSELAAVRGVRLRWVGGAFMIMLAVSVGLSSIVIGSILSTALLIGPPASALKMSSHVTKAVSIAVGLGVAATWLGIVFAYDSYYWLPAHRGLPVSFFVVFVVVIEFSFANLAYRFHARRVASTTSARVNVEPVGSR